ncbi:sensor histidine kinase [Hymenobacter properus]|uniref:histidine kinase n=1 Tax=Hymenobacter properus TaxID=2791026 RepID=A0A931BHU5_9BACT|nr:PAS domain-containing sensor histidine kinase [Hymenobacter properus]MBF9143839.1 PAS domain-containing sensor histidine kinase [Hymenobacter properus]MBR7722652.1 PAS domain-containing sensor histidine kinase [Microvirga sp. SRT04]
MPPSAKPAPESTLTYADLAKREHQLSVIFNTIADVTFVLSVEPDGRYRFIFANKAFEKATGVPVDKVVGREVREVIPEPSLSLVLTKYQEAATTRERVVWQEVSDYPTGRVTGEVSVAPVFDEAGRCSQLVGVVHDLTKEKHAEEQQRLLTERLMQQNSDLQQFAYIVSHNLRAPLANALGFTDLLTRLDKDSEAYDTSVQHLRTSLQQLDQVMTDVNDILSLRDTQAGYRPEPVALAAVCQLALEGLQEALQACGGHLHNAITEGLRVAGSRAYFHSIFYNLISNAIKYRSDARPLQIDVAASEVPDGSLTITVRDNGSGFDLEKASPHVFQLYRRFHSAAVGRGIGLFLVKAHVEAMGGHISVRSQVNVGTEFTIHFKPAADENLPH